MALGLLHGLGVMASTAQGCLHLKIIGKKADHPTIVAPWSRWKFWRLQWQRSGAKDAVDAVDAADAVQMKI